MTFSQQIIEIPSYAGIKLKQSLAGMGGKRLMVLLPGLGYTIHAPLLHYLRQIAWQHGDDVLSLQYAFQVAQIAYEAEKQGEISQESQASIEAALAKGYEELFLVGKSLGTPLAAIFANHFPQTKKALLLTPIQNSHQLIQKTPTLAIIGTADSRYSPELAQDTNFVRWQVYEGLDHSLEYADDVLGSIHVMSAIMAVCEAFLYDIDN